MTRTVDRFDARGSDLVGQPARRGRAPLLVALAMLLAMAGGCQNKKGITQTNRNPAVKSRGGPPVESASSARPLIFDSCADRLHDIIGMLWNYQARYRRLPATLDELSKVAFAGQELNFTCPESGIPYTYVPDGLPARDGDERLYVFDAQPVHHSKPLPARSKVQAPPVQWRWGIISYPDGDVKVVPMDDKFFRRFAGPAPVPIEPLQPTVPSGTEKPPPSR